MSGNDRTSRTLHERARALASASLDGELKPVESQFLADHLAACAECRGIAAEYRVLHDELRKLATPVPPRDLWARTSARLDEMDRARVARRTGVRRFLTGFALAGPSMLGTAAAVAVVVIVVGVSAFSERGLPVVPSQSTTPPRSTEFAIASGAPQPDVKAVGGDQIVWFNSNKGQTQIMAGGATCAGDATSGCTLGDGSGQPIVTVDATNVAGVAVDAHTQSVAVWTSTKVLVVQRGTTVVPGQVTPAPTILATATPTPPATPNATPTPNVTPTSSTASSTNRSSPTPTGAGPASPSPTESPSASPTTSATAASGPVAILDNYEVVGQTEFSTSGAWVAFAARPTDKSAGPDVFVWHQGDVRARAVTSSHTATFSGWWGDRLLLSQVETGGSTTQAVSYVVDPATNDTRRILEPMLRPVVDPSGQYVVYWSGALKQAAAPGQWLPAEGDLYLRSIDDLATEPASLVATPSGPSPAPASSPPATPAPSSSPSAGPSASTQPEATNETSPDESASASASPVASESAGTTPVPTPPSPAASPSAVPSPSPALPQLLPAAGPGAVVTWDVRWDPRGEHVGVWVEDPGKPGIGHVSLFAVYGGRAFTDAPVLSAPAMAGFQLTNVGIVYSSPSTGGDGKTHIVRWPQLPPPDSTSSDVPDSQRTEVPGG